MNPRVLAVVVTYYPDIDTLKRLLDALSPQVTDCIVVNNGISLPLNEATLLPTNCTVSHLQANKGVAAALNIGFQWAQSQDADFVITFDQDSVPAPDMVEKLLKAYQTKIEQGHHVGAVGPQQVDSRTSRLAPFIVPILWRRKKVTPKKGETVEVDHLITSGCLVPLNAWLHVGPFLESLFIDYVDIEWCVRSRLSGFSLWGAGGAYLNHTMGDAIKNWGPWSLPQHHILRHYFMIRNGVYLLTLPKIPFVWKIFEAAHIFKRVFFYILTNLSNTAHLNIFLKGICDGRRGQLGSAPLMPYELSKDL